MDNKNKVKCLQVATKFMKPENFIKQGITKMLKADNATSPKRHLLETSERNITAYLRRHLGEIGYLYKRKKYQIDHEYNRVGMGDIPKNLLPECSKRRSGNVVPDIIVHLRGVKINDDRNANWLVIEVKKIAKFNGVVEEIRNKKQKEALMCDIQKLNCFREDERFQYQQAALIVFSNKDIWISLNNESFKNLRVT